LLTIKEIIQQLALDGLQLNGIVCKVTAVNELKADCEPLNGDAPLLNVRLVADESTNKYVLIPAVGSCVIVQLISNEDAYISMFSEVTEVLLRIGNVYFNADSTGFLLQKQNDTLKQILTLIVQAIQPIVVVYGNNPDYVKLTTALNKINNLLR
jgi:hypothetical protein